MKRTDRRIYIDMFDDNYQQFGFRAQLKAYTDGCSHPHKEPHSGGWAYVMLENHRDRSLDIDDVLDVEYGGKVGTTNNEMELMAIVKAVEWCPDHADIRIVTDSQYCITVLSQFKPVEKNGEMVAKFIELVSSKDIDCTFEWVKGHDSDAFNNYVDVLTNAGDAEIRLAYANTRR